MYDICVIGGGIVGKYIVSKLLGKNIAWVSSCHPAYTTEQSYQLAQHVGQKDTWKEKASGLISWPSREDIEQFPMTFEKWKNYEIELRKELDIRSLQQVGESEDYKASLHYLQKSFPQQSFQYFDAAHQTFSGPSFDYRQEYDHFWFQQKPKWTFLNLKPDVFHVERFTMDKGKAISINGYNENGTYSSIQAKHFVVAGHVPGTLKILQNTYTAHRVDDREKDLLGRYFSEHAQLSFGVLCMKQQIPRTTLPAVCYQDHDIDGFRFRLEFHFAPPRRELVELCLRTMPGYSADHFVKHFLRIAVVMHMPCLYGTRLRFYDGNTYKISTLFYWLLRHNKQVLLDILQKKIFVNTDMQILNQKFPFYFGGHMTGGISFPFMVDNNFFLNTIPNVSIASSATFPTSGLFNPAMTLLVCAKHILSTLNTCL